MDPAVLQNALGLGEVLEGAVDAGREVGHVPGLQHELGGGAGDRVSTPGGPPSRPGPRPPWPRPGPRPRPPRFRPAPPKAAALTGTWDVVTDTLRGCTLSCTHCSRSAAKRWGSAARSQASWREQLQAWVWAGLRQEARGAPGYPIPCPDPGVLGL